MEWQPIETAPKDGTCVLAFMPDGESAPENCLEVICFGKGGWFSNSYPIIDAPTLWMPLGSMVSLIPKQPEAGGVV